MDTARLDTPHGTTWYGRTRRIGLGLTGLTLAATALGVAPAQAATPLPTCTHQHLSARVAGSEGAAGSTYVTLRFTNTGHSACALLGHPGVSFVAGDDGHSVGLPAAKANDKYKVVKLQAGQSADATLRIANALNFPRSTCSPTAVRGLRVYPPGGRKSFFLKLSTTACAKHVRTMTINAVVHH